MVQHTTPFVFLLIVDAFRAMDPALEESSRMSGASRLRTFWRITLVLMLPVTTGAFILSFMRGIEAFESALFFGTPDNIQVLVTEIYRAINFDAVPDYQYATALAVSVMAFLFTLVLIQWKVLGGRSFHTVTGKGYAPGIIRLGRLRWVAFGVCVLFFVVAVLLPLGQLLIGSFYRFVGFYGRNMLTLEHWESVLGNRTVWRAFKNTMILGVLGSTATMILGGIVAYVTVRTRWRGRRLLETLAWLPWMMPGMVLGIGLLWGFAIIPGPIQI
jgi:iron(III) transport system permease protein